MCYLSADFQLNLVFYGKNKSHNSETRKTELLKMVPETQNLAVKK